jgi:hypothetical protein
MRFVKNGSDIEIDGYQMQSFKGGLYLFPYIQVDYTSG